MTPKRLCRTSRNASEVMTVHRILSYPVRSRDDRNWPVNVHSLVLSKTYLQYSTQSTFVTCTVVLF